MKPSYFRRATKEDRGQSLIEFALSSLLLVTLLLGVVEIGRMVLVYTTVANAARAGARYAIVHGSNSLATATQVQTVVKNFLSAAPMNTAAAGLSITASCSSDSGTTWATCSTTNAKPGSRVRVSVNYPYDPFLRYFPWGTINLGSTTQGVIAF
jgi:Flp pilus assembly protein TadG